MSQSSSSDTVGEFDERVAERSVVSESFVRGTVQYIVISRRVEYYSGSIGGVKHTGKLDIVEQWKNSDTRRIRDVGVDPSVFLDVYVEPLGETVRISMAPSDVVEFGEFESLQGHFVLTEESVEMKVDSESVEFERHGTYPRADDVSDTMTYLSWLKKRETVFDRGYECGEVIEEQLREAWAKNEGIYSGTWEATVDESEYSSARICVEVPKMDEQLEFPISMDDWDDDRALRKLVEKDAQGLLSNLTGEEVFVSLGDYDNAVSECGPWKLYRKADMPLRARVSETTNGLVGRILRKI